MLTSVVTLVFPYEDVSGPAVNESPRTTGEGVPRMFPTNYFR